ncbi:MAG: sugar ABC transporter ATP-binding protein, partial [Parvibaculaceae bacterium]
LSVARTIFLGREPRGAYGLVERKRLPDAARALLRRLGLEVDAGVEVGRLSVAEQQLVEIARALSFESRILILDEPTAVLSLAERDKLFAMIRRLKAEGLLILYVSHHLQEVLEIADRITVLRDGRKVATRTAAELSVDDLVELMIGQSGAFTRPARRSGGAVAGASYRITYRTDKAESRLDLPAGEIVGIAGLVGAGRTTFARALTGSGLPTASAMIEHDGSVLRFSSPRAAISRGVVYITEDRKRDGIFGELGIVANATALALPSLASGPFRAPRRERQAAADMLSRLRLVASSLDVPIVTLSGGNQQKVLIGRALLSAPQILVCDEPTRGVDVGAKAEIHDILHDLADKGVAIIVISSEIEELLALAHRIVVMHERRFVVEMPAREADQTAILKAASGTSPVRREMLLM